MDATRKLYARKMFRLRVHEAKGVEYQRLLEKVMQYEDAGFVPIKPWGKVGDRKNDGYLPSVRSYFQVYAPEVPQAPGSVVTAAAKAAEDFGGLMSYWDSAETPVESYRFAFNDAYRGSPPQLEKALLDISASYGVKTQSFLAKDLEDIALGLEEDQIVDVINTPIPESCPLPDVEFGPLDEVIRHVFENGAPISHESRLAVPDFDQKIQMNYLSEGVAILLKHGSFQAEAIYDYFSKNSTFARQSLRDHLAALYEETRTRLDRQGASSKDEWGDLVYFDLLQGLMPRPKLSQAAILANQGAAQVVLAFFFESCDIFEEPDAAAI